MKNLIHLKK